MIKEVKKTNTNITIETKEKSLNSCNGNFFVLINYGSYKPLTKLILLIKNGSKGIAHKKVGIEHKIKPLIFQFFGKF